MKNTSEIILVWRDNDLNVRAKLKLIGLGFFSFLVVGMILFGGLFLSIYILFASRSIGGFLKDYWLKNPGELIKSAEMFSISTVELQNRVANSSVGHLILILFVFGIIATLLFIVGRGIYFVFFDNQTKETIASMMKIAADKEKAFIYVLFSKDQIHYALIEKSDCNESFNLCGRMIKGRLIGQVGKQECCYTSNVKVKTAAKWVIAAAVSFSLFIISMLFFVYVVRFFSYGILVIDRIAIAFSSDPLFSYIFSHIVSQSIAGKSNEYFSDWRMLLYGIFGAIIIVSLICLFICLFVLAKKLRAPVEVDSLICPLELARRFPNLSQDWGYMPTTESDINVFKDEKQMNSLEEPRAWCSGILNYLSDNSASLDKVDNVAKDCNSDNRDCEESVGIPLNNDNAFGHPDASVKADSKTDRISAIEENTPGKMSTSVDGPRAGNIFANLVADNFKKTTQRIPLVDVVLVCRLCGPLAKSSERC